MVVEMSMFNGIKKDDLVRIKFKDLKLLYSNLSDLSNKMEEYNYRGNIKSMLTGGIFQVNIGPTKDTTKGGLEFIMIDCHLDDDQLRVYEEMIESISVVGDAPSFKSGEHGFNIVRQGNILIINGRPLAATDPYTLNNSPGPGENKVDGNIGDFREFIEAWLIDVATEEALSGKK